VSEKEDTLNLDLPDAPEYISTPPKLTLEEYDRWCEEYWRSTISKPENAPVLAEEFVM
jgi:hypothetical protein